jgi:hypothetical protein
MTRSSPAAAVWAFLVGLLLGAGLNYVAIALSSHGGSPAFVVLIAGPILPLTFRFADMGFVYATIGAGAILYGAYACALQISVARKRMRWLIVGVHALGVLLAAALVWLR